MAEGVETEALQSKLASASTTGRMSAEAVSSLQDLGYTDVAELTPSRLADVLRPKVEGAWSSAKGDVTIKQTFQTFTGTIKNGNVITPITDGKLKGDEISFTVPDGVVPVPW